MSFLSADDITQAEHYTKQTVIKRWLILMLCILIICVRKIGHILGTQFSQFLVHQKEQVVD